MASTAKPSRLSRAYLHLLKDDDLVPLSERVRDTAFVDARGTANDPALLGPPIVEFSPYGRVPSSKSRKDGRQGTIDQDPEFIDFLKGLTEPIPKPTIPEGSGDKEPKSDEKIVTPLIQYLRDRKANKGKESASPAKGAKHARNESKESKSGQGDKKIASKASKENSQAEKKGAAATKIDKIARDAVKVATKQAAAVEAKAAASTTAAAPPPAAFFFIDSAST